MKHYISLKVGSSTGLYDGKKFNTVPAITKAGKLYLPIQFFSDVKLANVTWNKKQKYVDITMPSGFFTSRYKLGEPFLYFVADEKEFRKVPIPKPFIQNTNFYIPVNGFQEAYHKSLDNKASVMMVSWSETVFEKRIMPETVSGDDFEFTIIYDPGLYDPAIMQFIGVGGGISAPGKGKTGMTVFQGKTFKYITKKLGLKTGKNAFLIIETKGQLNVPFIIEKLDNLNENIPIDYKQEVSSGKSSKEFFAISSPDRGYITFNAPSHFMFQGQLNKDYPGNNKFTLDIGKLKDNQYQTYKTIEVPVTDRLFSSEINLPEKGSYLIDVRCPANLVSMSGSYSWAELRVEVK